VTDIAVQVRARAGARCEYCRLPQAAFRRAFHVEHIVARQHGGASTLNNLALACWVCNFKKGPNLTGIDLETREIIPLFHPRKDRWAEHFRLGIETWMPLGVEIQSPTQIGRVTIQVLGLNEAMRQMLRYELWLEEQYAGDIG
jgi:hypothetical protein